MKFIETVKKIDLREHQVSTLEKMLEHIKGIIVSPTGSGKTIMIMEDCKRFLTPGNVIVIVAPRLLLCQQLFMEFDGYLHRYQFVHRQVSSEKDTFKRSKHVVVQPGKPTNKPADIVDSYRIAVEQGLPFIIFSTFDSLDVVSKSGIPITTVYYDEAHNAVKNNHFNKVLEIGSKAENCYFFTATPRYSDPRNPTGRGMENTSVYGEVIAEIRFDYLVEKGYILKPKLHLQKSLTSIDDVYPEQVDFDSVRETVEYHEEQYAGHDALKILFCMSGTLAIKNLLKRTDLQSWASGRGYDVLAIDSKNGGYHNGEKLSNSKFIQKLKKLGDDPKSKFLVFHYEMIAEGIDIPGFSGVSFMRSTVNSIFSTQTIGRVIRPAGEWKKYGLVTIVEHKDDTDDVAVFTKNLVESLLNFGVPLDCMIFDVGGKGASEEVIEDLEDDIQKKMKKIELDWNHSELLKIIEDEIANQPDEFINRVF
jgi:superfamily II DNA or RNA helicase